MLKSGNYVAWGVRHREVAPERNTGENEFRLLYLSLVNRACGLPIVVVSDHESCEFFRKIAKKFNFECLFSDDFSESFLDDASIAIGGKIFFKFVVVDWVKLRCIQIRHLICLMFLFHPVRCLRTLKSQLGKQPNRCFLNLKQTICHCIYQNLIFARLVVVARINHNVKIYKVCAH